MPSPENAPSPEGAAPTDTPAPPVNTLVTTSTESAPHGANTDSVVMSDVTSALPSEAATFDPAASAAPASTAPEGADAPAAPGPEGSTPAGPRKRRRRRRRKGG